MREREREREREEREMSERTARIQKGRMKKRKGLDSMSVICTRHHACVTSCIVLNIDAHSVLLARCIWYEYTIIYYSRYTYMYVSD